MSKKMTNDGKFQLIGQNKLKKDLCNILRNVRGNNVTGGSL